MKNGRIIKSSTERHLGTGSIEYKPEVMDYTQFRMSSLELGNFSSKYACFKDLSKTESKGNVFLFHDLWMHT